MWSVRWWLTFALGALCSSYWKNIRFLLSLLGASDLIHSWTCQTRVYTDNNRQMHEQACAASIPDSYIAFEAAPTATHSDFPHYLFLSFLSEWLNIKQLWFSPPWVEVWQVYSFILVRLCYWEILVGPLWGWLADLCWLFCLATSWFHCDPNSMFAAAQTNTLKVFSIWNVCAAYRLCLVLCQCLT